MHSNARELQPGHGGPHHAEFESLGIDPAEVLDFSVNVNPYGPAASVLRAAREAPVDRYLDPTETSARARFGEQIGWPTEGIILGNGAAELLWSLAAVLASSTRPALIVGPTFSEYESAVRSHGGTITTWRARKDQEFAVDLDAIHRRIGDTEPASLYICTPNNPTGSPTDHAQLHALADHRPDVVFIVDQAFLSLSPQWRDAHEAYPENVVTLRSLTKDHSVPGLRVAYALLTPTLRQRVESRRAPWSVSAPAQAALLATCEETDFIAESRDRIKADKSYLVAALRRVGFDPLRSSASFVMVPVASATELRARLLREKKILVRDCSSFGLPGYIRLAVRPRAEVDRLIRALSKDTKR